MKLFYRVFAIIAILLSLSACNSNGIDRFSILKKCTVLGDESIVYARAYYVKLFYHFNPNKFSDSYNHISNFDAVTIKNTISTYERAVNKIDINTPETQSLLSACKALSNFSTEFVENKYPKAIMHSSSNDPLSDDFFIEINQIVKFDHNIGDFDKNQISFKQTVDIYKKAVNVYIRQYRKDIPTEFINQRLAN